MPESMPEDLNVYDVYGWTWPRQGDGYAVLLGNVDAFNASNAKGRAAERWPQYRKQTRRYPVGRLIIRLQGDTTGVRNIRERQSGGVG